MNRWISFLIPVIALLWMSMAVTGDHQSSTEGKRWALLVAGSYGYGNYRHQADVCHAYQILKKGGLPDENIIVFMYDDIANNKENKWPGKIFNKRNGPNVYEGVPKDYTGDAVSVKNFFAVLSGNKSATTGGSGKVLDSGPDDIVFIYYTDHGNTGIIGMLDDMITADELVDALKKKHAANSYKKMVIYLEACESGSMFEGLLPDDINIYATTAANAEEDSWACYCYEDYNACLGDLYSVSWMEDSDKHDSTKETLEKQYEHVRKRTIKPPKMHSHVMQYGDMRMRSDYLATYLGSNRDEVYQNFNLTTNNNAIPYQPSSDPSRLISQRDAKLFYLRHKLEKAMDGSNEKLQAQKELDAEMAHRKHVDKSVNLIGNLLFGEDKSSNTMVHVRPAGQPLVDDWECFKTLMKTYERHCGGLSSYGRKYTRAFANMCNAGISEKQLIAASLLACPGKNHAS
ncbi:vacuolar-processing enzyme-like [Lotus japonicus]|uniref:vacuolar-processing enzyme-like n=1 Tax=Lotus japonicus TaxID=34305 RepID=UPI0025887B3B|nr:vacuolar-processing enzyme-like [Lotus japonicus]